MPPRPHLKSLLFLLSRPFPHTRLYSISPLSDPIITSIRSVCHQYSCTRKMSSPSNLILPKWADGQDAKLNELTLQLHKLTSKAGGDWRLAEKERGSGVGSLITKRYEFRKFAEAVVSAVFLLSFSMRWDRMARYCEFQTDMIISESVRRYAANTCGHVNGKVVRVYGTNSFRNEDRA